MKFMEQTAQDDVLTISANDLRVIKRWVDGSYAVHPGCKNQMGAMMSLGVGSVYSFSQNRKI